MPREIPFPEPVPARKEGTRCPEGTAEVRHKEYVYCYGLSDCPDGSDSCVDPSSGETCRVCAPGVQGALDSGHNEPTELYSYDRGKGFVDRWCRRVGDGDAGGQKFDGKVIPLNPGDPHPEEAWRFFRVCPPRGYYCPDVGPSPPPSPPPGGPCPMPDRCPTLTTWRGSLLQCTDSNHQTICQDRDGNVFHGGECGSGKSPLPTEGGACVGDTTPGFGGGRGQPCNDHHNAVCSCAGSDLPAESQGWRRCEDPRGPAFTWSAPAGVSVRVGDNPFQLHFGGLQRGDYEWTSCPRPDARDALGKPLTVAEGACQTRRFSVR